MKGLFYYCLLASLLFTASANAVIRLPRLIQDGMVLQRDAPLKIWGWADPGEKVQVTLNGKKAIATADATGKWLAGLPAMKAGGPYEMRLQGKTLVVLKDILLGDVWLCSGQSNMVHQLSVHNVRYAKEIASANYPAIRQFWVPTLPSMVRAKDDLPQGSWKWANPKDVNDFSAVAYFFARDIYEKYHIPIGIINSSVGGTPIEAWTSAEGLKDFAALAATIKRNSDTAQNNANRRPPAAGGGAPGPRVERDVDLGTSGAVKWYDPAYVPKNWRTITVPGYWEDQGVRNLDGVVWYRKEVIVPAGMTGKAAKLHLGRIVDADVVYVNGKQVGNTTYMYPQRRYPLAADVLKAGKNIIVVRVQNNSGKGGFVPDKPYYLECDSQRVDIKGDWQYKVGLVNRPPVGRMGGGGGGGGGVSEQNQPTALYNGMIAPFINFTIKGVLWYQGESNTGNAQEYEKLLPALIADWRTKFSNPALPFYYVQLPGFGDYSYLPSESGTALVREGCLKTLSVPNTGMAVAIDLGEWNDIHPDNKKDVGDRLALIARHFLYGEPKLVYSGPLYQSSEIAGNKIVISFTNIGSGLISIDDEPLSQFAIAGADKRFVWAKAKIDNGKVVVWSDEVPEPKYVRYAWADTPVDPNLYNAEKLPASPFRTDL